MACLTGRGVGIYIEGAQEQPQLCLAGCGAGTQLVIPPSAYIYRIEYIDSILEIIGNHKGDPLCILIYYIWADTVDLRGGLPMVQTHLCVCVCDTYVSYREGCVQAALMYNFATTFTGKAGSGFEEEYIWPQ